MAYAAGQWPAALATAGCTALLVGLRPRLTSLAWLPLVASATLALLGDLLGVPHQIQDLGFFRHVPDVAGPDPQIGGLLLLTALGAGLCVLGVVGTIRRDIVTG